MSSTSRLAARRGCRALAAAVVLALAPAACGSSGAGHVSSSPSAGMAGMGGMATGDGLSSAQDGYRLASQAATLPPGRRTAYRFTVTGPDGRPVTDFALDQTQRLHFYAVRSDLTGFQHVHPAMAADGTWNADLAPLAPGSWRVFATFTPAAGAGKGREFVLSRAVTVPGAATRVPLPAPTDRARVDGYTVTVKGRLTAGTARTMTVSLAHDGRPVTDLQPYLGTYAHLTAFHEGDGAFAHLHPLNGVKGDHGGPDLVFHTELAASGDWRLFLQFETGGTVHTAALTLHVD